MVEAVLAIFILGVALNGCWGQYPYHQLRQHLLKDYDKFARPVIQASQGIMIETSLSPIYLTSVDERSSVMTMQAWIVFKWKDEFLTWDPSSFSGIKHISIPNSEVWKADVALYNSLPMKNVRLIGSTNVLVYSDGSVMWVPAFTLETLCSLDKESEVQKCNITIGSWTESQNYIDFKLSEKSIDTSNIIPNPLWKIVETKAVRQAKFYDCCKEPYVSVSFTFDLIKSERGYISVKEVMCGTTLVSVILALAMFWLPSDSDKKFTLGSLSVLILAMLLHLGHASKVVMVESVSFTKVALFVVVIAILIEIIIVNIARMKPPCKTPNIAAFLLSGTVGRVLLLMPSYPERPSQYQDSEKNGKAVLHHTDSEPKESHLQWALIATALDRVFFVVFLIVFIVERSI